MFQFDRASREYLQEKVWRAPMSAHPDAVDTRSEDLSALAKHHAVSYIEDWRPQGGKLIAAIHVGGKIRGVGGRTVTEVLRAVTTRAAVDL